MIKLREDIQPSQAALDKLADYQKEIDDLATFAERSIRAKTSFPTRNTTHNRTFKAVKRALTDMCNSTRRCVYCEDSLADEVEHIFLKDLYPEKCFRWENYVYACGPCNGPKNNKFAVFRSDTGIYQEVTPPQRTPPSEPPPGEPVMINPRIEDPLQFCMLDLQDTFKFVPLPGAAKDVLRAEYTYNTILRLNEPEREPLREARKNAFGMYRARLFEYVVKKSQGVDRNTLEKMINGIQKESHPTVWKEMQRQHRLGILNAVDPELNQLFVDEPEALNW